MSYNGWETDQGPVRHQHDDRVWLGGYDAVFDEGSDAVISLCRMGSEMLDAEHVEFWLVDDGPAVNASLDFAVPNHGGTWQIAGEEGPAAMASHGPGGSTCHSRPIWAVA